MKLTRLVGYLLKSWPDRSNLACLLASVSSCPRCFFKHCKRKSRLTILLTERWLIPISRAICLCVRCVCGMSSWLCTSDSTFSTLSTDLAVRGRPLPGRRRKDPVLSIFAKRNFNPLRVQPLPGNSFKKRFAPYFLFFLRKVITCLFSSVNAILSAFKWRHYLEGWSSCFHKIIYLALNLFIRRHCSEFSSELLVICMSYDK